MNDKNDILNELNELKINLPILNFPNTDLPNNYFETFHNELFEEINTTNFISNLPKTNPYSLKENYFNDLNKEITKKIISTNAQKRNSLKIIYSKISIAATILFFIGCSFFLLQTKQNSTSSADFSKVQIENKLSQISDLEIENYIKEHQFEFDTQITFQKMDESKVDFHSLENDIYNVIFDDVNSEDIKNLL